MSGKSNRKLIVTVASVLLVAIGATLVVLVIHKDKKPATVAAYTCPSTIYKDPSGRFCIKPPAGWAVAAGQQPGVIAEVKDPAATTYSITSITITKASGSEIKQATDGLYGRPITLPNGKKATMYHRSAGEILVYKSYELQCSYRPHDADAGEGYCESTMQTFVPLDM